MVYILIQKLHTFGSLPSYPPTPSSLLLIPSTPSPLSPISPPLSLIPPTPSPLSPIPSPLIPIPPFPLVHVTLPSPNWSMQTCACSSRLFIQESPSSSSHPLQIPCFVTMASDLSWTAAVNLHELTNDICTTLFTLIPKIVDKDTLTALVSQIDNMNICPRLPDKKFIEMVSEQKGKLFNSSGEVAAYLDRGHEVF